LERFLPQIILNIPEDLYKAILERASREGYKDPYEYLLRLIVSALSSQGLDLGRYIEDLVAKYTSRSERKLSDILNAYTSKIEELASKIASLYEDFEEIKSKIQEIEGKLQEMERAGERETPVERQAQQARKATAIEILKQQKVFYESSIYGKIKNRDKFFQKLEREGAIIINTERERIAIDKDFWEGFTSKISRIRGDSEEAIRSVMSDRKELELFERLKESANLIYDATEKRWKLVM
jgi:hypothetical protein